VISKLLSELKKLNLPAGKFAVFGSGPLAVRGLREVGDLDVIVTPDVWRELAKRFPVEDHRDHKKVQIGQIEICNKAILDYDVRELIGEAEEIGGVRFVTLERTREWKKRLGRGKDREDIELIDRYLSKK